MVTLRHSQQRASSSIRLSAAARFTAVLSCGCVFAVIMATSQLTNAAPQLDPRTRYEDFKLLASDGGESDRFGGAVAVSGPVAIIGAAGDDDLGPNAGAAYIFHFDERTGHWFEQQKLTASDGAAEDAFGISVDIDGDRAIVGSYGDDDHGQASGSAYVFRYLPDRMTWIEEKKLVPTDGAAGDAFGISVALHQDVALIGAYADGDLGSYSGSAYAFRFTARDGRHDWFEEQKLLAPDGAANHHFGYSVSIFGDFAVVGASQPYSTGAAYVYRYLPDHLEWVRHQKLLAPDGSLEDRFGSAVSIHGNHILVGAYAHAHHHPYAGAAYTWRLDDHTQDWVPEQELLATDATASDFFGRSVSLSRDVAVIGAYSNDDNGSSSGSAYVFRFNPDARQHWFEHERLLASDGSADDSLGWSVGVFGDTAVAGSVLDGDNGHYAGSAYVYHLKFCRGLTLNVTSACPDSGRITIDWCGATPDAPVALIFSRERGDMLIPWGYPCAGAQLGLGPYQIQMIGPFVSDADGSGQKSGMIQNGACGSFLQLLDVHPCKLSEVVTIGSGR